MRYALLALFLSLNSGAIWAADSDPVANPVAEPSPNLQRRTFNSPAPRPSLSGPEIRALQYREADPRDEEDKRTLREDNQ